MTNIDRENKLLVIKCGGSIINNYQELNSMLQDLLQLKQLGYQIILLHGGGPDINQLCNSLKIESTFSNGLRVTTPDILAITQMALLGKTNLTLVHKLNQTQLASIGLSGHDLNLLIANFIDKDSLGYVGEIHKINTEFLTSLLNLGIMPVIAPLAIDNEGNTLNINADLAASAVAVAIKAHKLILISDIDGYYANYPDKSSLVKQLVLGEIETLLATPDQVSEGMRPKLSAGLNAVIGGVNSAHIINGNQMNSLMKSVENPSNVGTTIIKRGEI